MKCVTIYCLRAALGVSASSAFLTRLSNLFVSIDAVVGRLWTFGDNSEGALGDGTQQQIDTTPQAFVLLGPSISPPIRFAAISAGLFHTIALAGPCAALIAPFESDRGVDDGSVWTWGRGENGRLGHGNNEPISRPRRIESFDNNRVLTIAAGYHHSMAINHKSQIYCWGSGWSGQLGTGDNKDEHKARLVDCSPILYTNVIFSSACPLASGRPTRGADARFYDDRRRLSPFSRHIGLWATVHMGIG